MSYESSLSVEERVSSLFQPDTLLPAQYLETVRRKTHLDPEKKLMLAVLEDGVTSYQKYIHAQDGKEKNLFREAEEWILNENSDWLFSFESICESLGLNPKYIREGLIRWKENKLAERTTAKVVRLAPRGGEKKRGMVSHGADRKLRKAANR